MEHWKPVIFPPMKFPESALVLLILLAVFAGIVGANVPLPSAAPRQVSNLAGQLLVANRQLLDPNFARSVVYLIAHSDDGAIGLVVNRVYGTTTLQTLLHSLGIKTRTNRKQEVPLHYGGPVGMNHGFVLHSDDYAGASTQLFQNHIALSTGLDVMQALAKGRGPKRRLVLAGYAGWGAGQLERELARNDWLVASADPALIFTADPATIWEKALQRAGMRL